MIDVVLCSVCLGSLDESAEAWGRVGVYSFEGGLEVDRVWKVQVVIVADAADGGGL